MKRTYRQKIIESYRELHRELWQWLADHPLKNKYEWPRWSRNGGDIEKIVNNCFACALDPNLGCEDCPCKWGTQDGELIACDEYPSPYYYWERATIAEHRTKYALQVKEAWPEGD
jgi:hypothetical protein